MKKYIIFFLTFISINTGNAQGWQWQNPLPQGNSLSSVFFTNATSGYAVGDYGTILKTTNSGTSWTVLTSVTIYDLTSVYFTDGHIGYAVGGAGTILKTIDEGLTWTALSDRKSVV